MSILVTVVALSAAVAKALVKNAIGNNIAEALVSETIDLFKGAKIKANEKRDSAARLDEIANQIAAQLSTEWQGHEFRRLDEGTRAAVPREVIAALEGSDIDTVDLLDAQLDADVLTDRLLSRPFSERHLQENERALSRRMVREAAARLVAAAPELPDFQRRVWASVLDQLAELRSSRADWEHTAAEWEAEYRKP